VGRHDNCASRARKPLKDIDQLMIDENKQMKLTLDYRDIIKCLRGEKDSFGVEIN